MDDAGAGYSGLQNMIMLKPSIIKLDRTLVTGIDVDETRRALVETVGSFAERINASLLAEGIERMEELEVLKRLGVPLAQGYLLGRPAARLGTMPGAIAARLKPIQGPKIAVSPARSSATLLGSPAGLETTTTTLDATSSRRPGMTRAAADAYANGIDFAAPPDTGGAPIGREAVSEAGDLAAAAAGTEADGAGEANSLFDLLETVPSVSSPEQARAVLAVDAELDVVVLLDPYHCPASLVTPEQATVGLFLPATTISVTTSPSQAATMAMARERSTRFQPIICTDDLGRFVGIVRIERLVERLAEGSADGEVEGRLHGSHPG